MSNEIKTGKIELDNQSIELIRGLRTRQRYELAVEALAPTIRPFPFDVFVKSRLSDTTTANPPVHVDEAMVKFHNEKRKPVTFTREPGFLWGLESPKGFLKRVLQDSINPNSESK